MGANTKIEWADHSWSPWRGCTKVSPGCANCYAEKLSKRNPSVLGSWGKGAPMVMSKSWGDPVRWNSRPLRPVCPNRCGAVITIGSDGRAECPRCDVDCDFARPRIFPSLCDWLDDEVSPKWLAEFLALINLTPHLDWLLLTKRPSLWRERIDAAALASTPFHQRWLVEWLRGNPPTNVWFGVSVEDQQRSDARIPQLLEIPARVRWLSVEPLLGPVTLGLRPSVKCPHCDNYVGGHATGGHDICDCRLDWVVVGGESGPRARPCNVAWIRDIMSQCSNAGVPCFVKQLGARPVVTKGYRGQPISGDFWTFSDPKGGDPSEWPEDLRVRQFPEVKP